MTKLTPKDHAEILRMHEAGVPVEEIAKSFGVVHTTIYRAVNPDYAERQRSYRRKWKQAKRVEAKEPLPRLTTVRADPQIERDAEARLAEIPRDTRDLTAFAFGDPLPGRSALDRRQGQT